jgi:hypothetical protein
MGRLSSARTSLGLALVFGAALSQPARALDRTQLAVIVNTLDPLSVRIGAYYAAKRGILFQNLIKVSFPSDKTTLSRREFDGLKAQVDRQITPGVQA